MIDRTGLTGIDGALGGGHDRAGRDTSFRVTVRTLAGHTDHEQVRSTDTVSELTTRMVGKFVARHQLNPGDYALTLPRLGSATNLDPTGTLAEVGVRAHDVLVLVSRAPQVDG
jgi:hypothetical protein